jgi:hypothetical protein
MARASQTTQPIVQTGTTATLTAPAVSPNGDIIDTGRTILMVDNAGGSSITVTITPTKTIAGLSLTPLVVTVAAGAIKLIGPFPPAVFGQLNGSADFSRAYVDYSAVASVTRGVFSI